MILWCRSDHLLDTSTNMWWSISKSANTMTSSNGNIYCPFLLGIRRSRVNSPHKDQWRGALMFSLICAWTNSWSNNQDANDLRRHRAHYDVSVMRNGIMTNQNKSPRNRLHNLCNIVYTAEWSKRCPWTTLICLVFNFFLIHNDKMTVIWQCSMVSI